MGKVILTFISILTILVIKEDIKNKEISSLKIGIMITLGVIYLLLNYKNVEESLDFNMYIFIILYAMVYTSKDQIVNRGIEIIIALILSLLFKQIWLVYMVYIELTKKVEEEVLGKGDLLFITPVIVTTYGEHFMYYSGGLIICSIIYVVINKVKNKKEIPYIPVIAIPYVIVNIVKIIGG